MEELDVVEVKSGEHTPVYRHFLKKMRRQEQLLKMRCIAITVIAIILGIILILNIGNYLIISNKVSELEDDFIEIYIEREQESIAYQDMVCYVDTCEVQIEELSTALSIAEDQNIVLLEENEAQKEAIEELQKRQEKYDRYSYALYDTAGRRNDLTYEDLLLLEDLCRNSRVDQDLVLSIVMVESEGNETCKNSKSTARGYGQFIKSTGKFVYENLMGNPSGSYTHDMALDGDINLTMMVRYLEYLYSRFNSTDSVINSYRGIKDQPYKNKINAYLNRVGKSLGTV